MRDLGDERVSRTLAGSLLVAHPNMIDPNFRRTVLFISEHEPNEGALGVIINRPLDRPVAELVSDTPPAGLADVPVFLGGPVGKNQLMFAAFEWQKGAGLKLKHNIAKQKAWVVQNANPSLLKLDRLPNLWFDIMRTLGPWYKMLAAAPDDPSLN